MRLGILALALLLVGCLSEPSDRQAPGRHEPTIASELAPFPQTFREEGLLGAAAAACVTSLCHTQGEAEIFEWAQLNGTLQSLRFYVNFTEAPVGGIVVTVYCMRELEGQPGARVGESFLRGEGRSPFSVEGEGLDIKMGPNDTLLFVVSHSAERIAGVAAAMVGVEQTFKIDAQASVQRAR